MSDDAPVTAVATRDIVSAPVHLSRTYITGPTIVNTLRNMRAEVARMQAELTNEWRVTNDKSQFETHPNHYEFESIKNQISTLMGKLL